MQVLVHTNFDSLSPTLNWQTFPLNITEGTVLLDIDGDINSFLLGKKFVNNELVSMTSEEAEAQLIAITQTNNENRYVYPRDFLKRFTADEKNAIYTSALTDIVIAQIKDDLVAAEYVDLLNTDLLNGMNILVTKSLITNERKDIILTI